MASKRPIDKQHLDWTSVEPEKIESPALRNLVSRIQQVARDTKGQATNSNDWSNWRDTVWKQRR